MRAYYEKPYPTARDIIRDKEYDYISYRIYKDGEEEFYDAFKTSQQGKFIALRDDDSDGWIRLCSENIKLLCSEEWSTPEIKHGLTIVAISDKAEYTGDTWPFLIFDFIRPGTYVDVICSDGNNVSGNFEDVIIKVNKDILEPAILLSNKDNTSDIKPGDITVSFSSIKDIKRKETVQVP